MEALNGAVDEWVTILAGVIALYFFISMVVNLAQAQLSTVTGDALGHAHALQQAVGMVILLAVAASARSLVPALQAFLAAGSGAESTEQVLEIWLGLARFVVSVIVGGSGILTTVGVVYGALGAQVHHALGAGASGARLLLRIPTLIAGGILTVCSVALANSLLDLIF